MRCCYYQTLQQASGEAEEMERGTPKASLGVSRDEMQATDEVIPSTLRPPCGCGCLVFKVLLLLV